MYDITERPFSLYESKVKKVLKMEIQENTNKEPIIRFNNGRFLHFSSCDEYVDFLFNEKKQQLLYTNKEKVIEKHPNYSHEIVKHTLMFAIIRNEKFISQELYEHLGTTFKSYKKALRQLKKEIKALKQYGLNGDGVLIKYKKRSLHKCEIEIIWREKTNSYKVIITLDYKKKEINDE